MRLKISDKMHSANRLVLYLLLIAVLSLFCFLTLDLWLLPYSIAHAETGKITAGYAVDMIFRQPSGNSGRSISQGLSSLPADCVKTTRNKSFQE